MVISGGFVLLLVWFASIHSWKTVGQILAAAGIHELGHCLALWCFGAKIRQLRVETLGAVLETDQTQLSYGQELIAALAGPAANFLCAAAWIVLQVQGWEAWIGVHLVLGTFNLLPIPSMDGGRALCLAVSWGFGPSAGERITRLFGTVTAVFLMGLLLYIMVRTGGSLWLLPALGGLLAEIVRIYVPND